MENGTAGTFMALGPRNGRSMAEVLYGIAAVVTSDLQWTWADTDFLLESGVRPYSDLPVWIPTAGDRIGFARFDLTREIEAGLTYRSLATTAEETLEWFLSLPPERTAELRTGLSPQREAEVLRAWHQAEG
jgi:2'-hydroxyisoflavone reductase